MYRTFISAHLFYIFYSKSIYSHTHVHISILFLSLVPPVSHPINITARPETKTVFLSWTQSDQDIVNYYNITYKIISGCASAPGTRKVSGLLRSYNLTGLEEYITYGITVSAANIRGLNTSSEIQVTTSAAGKLHYLIHYMIHIQII